MIGERHAIAAFPLCLRKRVLRELQQFVRVRIHLGDTGSDAEAYGHVGRDSRMGMGHVEVRYRGADRLSQAYRAHLVDLGKNQRELRVSETCD